MVNLKPRYFYFFCCIDWSDWKVNWSSCCITESYNSCKWLQIQTLQGFFIYQECRSCSIVQWTGIGGSDCTILLENCSQSRHLLEIDLLILFVLSYLSLLLLDSHSNGNNLVFKDIVLPCHGTSFVAVCRILILIMSWHFKLLGSVFSTVTLLFTIFHY